LANELGAVADKEGVENTHGVDLIIGGHDHIYYIGKGAKSWEGDVGGRDGHGTEADKGVRYDLKDLYH
jgi:5'-nucleotidase